jgi:hypothetical protein
MTVLGPGAVCCGDALSCAVECDQKDLLLEPAEAVEEPQDVDESVDPIDEEEDDE